MKYRNTPLRTADDAIAQEADHRIGWSRLPRLRGILVLVGLRNILRQRNLYDTSCLPSSNSEQPTSSATAALSGRTADGSYNDLKHPAFNSWSRTGSATGRARPAAFMSCRSPKTMATRQALRILFTATDLRLGVWLPHPAVVANPSYPADPTIKQLYDSAEFDAYRVLGYATAELALASSKTRSHLPGRQVPRQHQ